MIVRYILVVNVLLIFISNNKGCNQNDLVVLHNDTTITYYSVNQPRSKCIYKNGVKEGISVEYFENGNIASISNYHKGDFCGEVTFFYPDGKKNFQEFYDSSGKSTGLFSLWFENGQIKQQGMIMRGKWDGKWVNYYENGKIESIEHYSFGKKDSTWVYYAKTGELIKKELYQSDSLIKATK